MRLAPVLVRIFQTAYGGFYLFVGIWGAFFVLAGAGNPFEPEPGCGADFQAALEATGFMVPLMLASFVLGGGALLTIRTAPAGILLLAPTVTVIFFYHLMLGGSIIWASFWAAGLLGLGWRYRRAYLALVTYRQP